METELKKKATYRWEIDNFSERDHVIKSDPFSSGGCEWFLCVYPKGDLVDDHLSLFLFPVNPESSLPGWRRRARPHFELLNQSGKVLLTTTGNEPCKLFSAETPGWGYHRMLPLTKLQEKGFLEDNKLIIDVYLKVVKVIHEGKSTENEMVAVNGFYVVNTQAISVSKILAEHPDFALDIRSNIREVKTAYMNILLELIETLSKPPRILSEIEISNADCKLIDLTEAGFKLDWLKLKLEEVSLEREKPVLSCSSQVQQLENVELTLSNELDKEEAVSCGSQVQQHELTLLDLKVGKLDNENIKSAGAAKVSWFQFKDFFVWRCFLSCFSFSEHQKSD